jgi:hypothetical protein
MSVILYSILICFYSLLLILTIYYLTFANTNAKRINGKISRLLFEQIPIEFVKYFKLLLGERCYKYVERIQDYLVNQKNPILQIVYLLIINSAFIFWLIYGAAQLPTFLVSKVHEYIAIIGVMASQFTFYLACSVKPGQLLMENVDCFNHQPFDDLLYVENKTCKTCNVIKV